MKFEYKFLKVSLGVDNEEALKKLNDLGNEGWEAVSTAIDGAGDGIMVLKREKR